MKKKSWSKTKTYFFIITGFLILLLIPIPNHSDIIGKTVYKSLTYKMTIYHQSKKKGIKIEFLGKKIYQNIKIETESNESKIPKEKDQKRILQVNGKLYYDTGKESPIFARCGMMDGKITSNISENQIPSMDNQANFEGNYGYQYRGESIVDVFIDNSWKVFKTENEIDIEYLEKILKKYISNDLENLEELALSDIISVEENDVLYEKILTNEEKDYIMILNPKEESAISKIKEYLDHQKKSYQIENLEEYWIILAKQTDSLFQIASIDGTIKKIEENKIILETEYKTECAVYHEIKMNLKTNQKVKVFYDGSNLESAPSLITAIGIEKERS